VRRIAIHRTRLRRAYIASATSANVVAELRASTETVDRGRIGGVQRDQRLDDRVGAAGISGEMMAARHHTPPLLHRDPAQVPHRPHGPTIVTLLFCGCQYRMCAGGRHAAL
jgi:hypothetical protein